MNTRAFAVTAIVVSVVGAGLYGAYRYGMNQGRQTSGGNATVPIAQPSRAAPQVDPAAGRKVLYWHDPMVPGQKFDKPGKSPFMDMQLVPVYADSAAELGQVTVSPQVQQNLGVRTALVTSGTLAQTFEASGNIAFNERDVAVVSARVGGYVERLHVRATLDPVRKGQALVDLFAPEWVAVQEEYLSVRRMRGPGVEALLAAARHRMLLAGMTDEQVELVASSGKTQSRFTLAAPISGVITELGAREGLTVMPGAPLFRINGLSSVWINAEVAETRAAAIRIGTPAEARLLAHPGRAFKGRVAAILPDLNPVTRTIKARVEIANSGGLMAPGMFASITFSTGPKDPVLLVPNEAVIRTGKRTVVLLAMDDGKFRPVEVELGTESGDQIEIRKGLEAGQRVVVSGQFLIDSEASLKATTTRMSDPAPAGDAAPVPHKH